MTYQIVQEPASSRGSRLTKSLVAGLGGYKGRKASDEAKAFEREKLEVEINKAQLASKTTAFGSLLGYLKPVGGAAEKPYDPKEFWDSETGRWVMNIQKTGITPEGHKLKKGEAQQSPQYIVSNYGTEDMKSQYRIYIQKSNPEEWENIKQAWRKLEKGIDIRLADAKEAQGRTEPMTLDQYKVWMVGTKERPHLPFQLKKFKRELALNGLGLMPSYMISEMENKFLTAMEIIRQIARERGTPELKEYLRIAGGTTQFLTASETAQFPALSVGEGSGEWSFRDLFKGLGGGGEPVVPTDIPPPSEVILELTP